MQVTIFGQTERVERFTRGPGYVANIYLDDGNLRDWNQIPESLVIEGIPFVVNLMWIARNGWRRCFTVNDLVQYAWEQLNPNGFQLLKIEQGIENYRKRFREVEEGAGDHQKYKPLVFRWDKQRQRYNSVAPSLQNGQRIVYVPSRGFPVEAGVEYACTFVRDCVNNPPTPDRNGFRLIEVQVWHEHYDPDQRIAYLRSQIAAGNL